MVKSTERSGREGRIRGRLLEVIAGVYNEMGDEKKKIVLSLYFHERIGNGSLP